VTTRRARAESDPLESANAQRILLVAERLFARRGYRNVAVRHIAEAAHVTHPLIYHYFGSKRGLLAAVLDRTQARMRAASIDGEPPDVITALARNNVSSYRQYYLILVRAFVDGMHPSDWPGGYPTIEKLLEVLDLDRPRPGGRPSEAEMRELLAVGVAAVVGWILLEDQLLEIFDLPPQSKDEAREQVVRAFAEIVRPTLPPADS
jgi:AcrR family transcriptional regulator